MGFSAIRTPRLVLRPFSLEVCDIELPPSPRFLLVGSGGHVFCCYGQGVTIAMCLSSRDGIDDALLNELPKGAFAKKPINRFLNKDY
jgi:hypothetical protein